MWSCEEDEFNIGKRCFGRGRKTRFVSGEKETILSSGGKDEREETEDKYGRLKC